MVLTVIRDTRSRWLPRLWSDGQTVSILQNFAERACSKHICTHPVTGFSCRWIPFVHFLGNFWRFLNMQRGTENGVDNMPVATTQVSNSECEIKLYRHLGNSLSGFPKSVSLSPSPKAIATLRLASTLPFPFNIHIIEILGCPIWIRQYQLFFPYTYLCTVWVHIHIFK